MEQLSDKKTKIEITFRRGTSTKVVIKGNKIKIPLVLNEKKIKITFISLY